MNTLFVGQSRIHLPVVDSTNSYASEILRQNRPADGTLIYSFNQQKGKGQRGTYWESEANKNVALSLILYPHFLPAERQFLLSIITSLAVADVMAGLLGPAADLKIKWPNDIYVGERKIAGILIENTLRDQQIQSSIIGLGMNVNQQSFNSIMTATSLCLESKKEYDLKEVLQSFCEHMEARYLQLRSGQLEQLKQNYLKRLYRLGQWEEYVAGDEIIKGCIRGVNNDGRLLLERESGIITDLGIKEIRFV
jgi:BirA family biotin operon repressor/biotin-[acetyl-CoA-carboxylase] ligase